MKVVVRENTSGLTGSFEAPVIVPELKQAPLKMSSVAFGTQIQAAPSKATSTPLIHDGQQLVPNVTHVVGHDQKMFFFYEVYDPAEASAAPDLRTSLAFYKGRIKVYQTPLVERLKVDDPSRHAATFRLEVPAATFAPGVYTCQVNVIDSVASKFAFPRLTLLIKSTIVARRLSSHDRRVVAMIYGRIVLSLHERSPPSSQCHHAVIPNNLRSIVAAALAPVRRSGHMGVIACDVG